MLEETGGDRSDPWTSFSFRDSYPAMIEARRLTIGVLKCSEHHLSLQMYTSLHPATRCVVVMRPSALAVGVELIIRETSSQRVKGRHNWERALKPMCQTLCTYVDI